jgi:transposase InsO family protein
MSLKGNVKKKCREVHSRKEIVRVALEQGTQVAVAKFGIPARTIRSWKRRFVRFGVDGLENKSTAPIRVHNRIDPKGVCAAQLRELIEKEPGLRDCQLLAKLILNPGTEALTMSWLRRTKRRLGLVQKVRKVPKKEHKKRYEINKPGYLQIDTKSVKGRYGAMYQFTAIDECSRVRFLWSSFTKGAQAAMKFLELTNEYFKGIGVAIVRVQTDNGTEFTLPGNERTIASYMSGKTEDSVFTKKCNELNIQHRLIAPASPELNGKVERSHRTDEQRIYTKYQIEDHIHLQKILDEWLIEYNEQRPHSALGNSTPIDFLKKRLHEIKNTSTLGAQNAQQDDQLKNSNNIDDLPHAA